jgi:hypothetical protein
MELFYSYLYSVLILMCIDFNYEIGEYFLHNVYDFMPNCCFEY